MPRRAGLAARLACLLVVAASLARADTRSPRARRTRVPSTRAARRHCWENARGQIDVPLTPRAPSPDGARSRRPGPRLRRDRCRRVAVLGLRRRRRARSAARGGGRLGRRRRRKGRLRRRRWRGRGAGAVPAEGAGRRRVGRAVGVRLRGRDFVCAVARDAETRLPAGASPSARAGGCSARPGFRREKNVGGGRRRWLP